ncbi:hypothetical protein OGATHE_005799 [Ogataea polymorpha]|uniref:Uncharacterized protein n=1 Tax=Ogataea polymorpha TaxID=460523 RepID=A0A9P8NUQ9_9ASCO|nr:hypothetical protein OGATHE_005799 [Ogataea polymorpha]
MSLTARYVWNSQLNFHALESELATSIVVMSASGCSSIVSSSVKSLSPLSHLEYTSLLACSGPRPNCTVGGFSLVWPRNSQVEFRAKPCCGSWSNPGALLLPNTGNTSGMPPLTGLDPSSLAADDSHSCSTPSMVQDVMVAPYSSTDTLVFGFSGEISSTLSSLASIGMTRRKMNKITNYELEFSLRRNCPEVVAIKCLRYLSQAGLRLAAARRPRQRARSPAVRCLSSATGRFSPDRPSCFRSHPAVSPNAKVSHRHACYLPSRPPRPRSVFCTLLQTPRCLTS